ILDIGTGCGILALLMAVRFPDSQVMAIDIDEGAAMQAVKNVQRNGLQGRVEVQQVSLQEFTDKWVNSGQPLFDAVICNPPYFKNSLKCPDSRRSMARHTDTLSFHDLMGCAAKLLNKGGCISLIIPADMKGEMDYEATLAGMFYGRDEGVKTAPGKPVKRYLLEYLASKESGVKEELKWS
ncbi:MAG: methyltransferase, partial [Bacteroidaceae bacterium]|nr:methyltransferase [Bacteroidaceae bacterium]